MIVAILMFSGPVDKEDLNTEEILGIKEGMLNVVMEGYSNAIKLYLSKNKRQEDGHREFSFHVAFIICQMKSRC